MELGDRKFYPFFKVQQIRKVHSFQNKESAIKEHY